MMEHKFLIYLLYITLVEFRERAYETNDKRTFWLCDMLHNVPPALTSEDATLDAYNTLLEAVKTLGLETWLEHRKSEFYNLFPEYNLSN